MRQNSLVAVIENLRYGLYSSHWPHRTDLARQTLTNLSSKMNWTRREFFQASAIPAAGISLATASRANHIPSTPHTDEPAESVYTIGLSQYSLHRTISSGQLDPLDYPQFAIDQFGIDQIEVSTCVMRTLHNRLLFLQSLRSRSDQAGTNIFSMKVEPIRLVSDNREDRTREVGRFHPLVDQANVVGASFLRVCLDSGVGRLDQQATRAIDGLARLADYAAAKQLTIAVQSGAGAARNGLWLASVINEVDHPNCGSVPDLGESGQQDKYNGAAALMTSASVISAKSHAFDEEGLELQSDYPKLLRMIVDAGFRGTIAIEFEGQKSEVEGVKATQKLLQCLQESLAT